MKRFFGLAWLPLNADVGLLFLRVAVSVLMIRYHGWGKVTGWANEGMRQPNWFSLAGVRKEFHSFPDYLGIGSEVSYAVVAWCETFGSVFLIAGLLTRIHAAALCVIMAVAWSMHHGMRLTGPGHGELPFSWAFVYLLLFLAGPGKYSLDYRGGWLGGARAAPRAE